MDSEGNIGDLIDAQIEQQGASVIRVSDGFVFTFTRETLERLLEHTKEVNAVVVFVKNGPAA